MPVAATKHSAAGAQAFAEFFIKTIDWGYATTSSAYMRHYFMHACSGCARLRDAISIEQRSTDIATSLAIDSTVQSCQIAASLVALGARLS